MTTEMKITLAGRSRQGLVGIEDLLRGQSGIALELHHIVNGHVDPLQGVGQMPDALLLDLSQLWRDELGALSARAASDRPPLIVVGAADSPEAMRLAMQAGARDFFTRPVSGEELRAVIQQIARDKCGKKPGAGVTAVIDAKGGAGASFLAANLAHVIASHWKRRVALLELDLQFGSLPFYLDLAPRSSLVEALANADDLDEVALGGYMTRHGSGMHLLASMPKDLTSAWKIPEKNLERIIDIARRAYDHVLIDLPRQIDPLTSNVLERADMVLVVLSQELPHLRDAKQLLTIMDRDLRVATERIHFVVNRYHAEGSIALRDIRKTICHHELHTVPNDYARVTESLNSGVCLYDAHRGAAVTKALVNLANRLAGAPTEEPAKAGRLRAAINQLFRHPAEEVRS